MSTDRDLYIPEEKKVADFLSDGYIQEDFETEGHLTRARFFQKDGQRFVFKTAKNEKSLKLWQNAHVRSLFARRQVHALPSVPVHIPKEIDFGEYYAFEECVTGKPLDLNLYHTLPAAEQDKIAADIADFLYVMHHGTLLESDCKEIPISPIQSEINNLIRQICSHDELALHNRLFNTASPLFYSMHYALTHADLRSENVFYDTQTKQVSIIDFGIAKKGNTYSDFSCPVWRHTYWPWQLTADIVKHYNAHEHTGRHITIDIETVKNLQLAHLFDHFIFKLYKHKWAIESEPFGKPEPVGYLRQLTQKKELHQNINKVYNEALLKDIRSLFINEFRPLIQERTSPDRVKVTSHNGRFIAIPIRKDISRTIE